MVMYNMHNKIYDFHEKEVRITKETRNELFELKRKNAKRLENGLGDINDEREKSYYLVDSHTQGSVAMSTVTQNDEGEYDIDIAVIFDRDNIPSSPLDARKLVCDALKKRSSNFRKDPEARTNAVTVWYKDGYHVDFAVYRRYKENEDDDTYKYEHAGSQWTSRVPKAIKEWYLGAIKDDSPSVEDKDVTVKKNQLRRLTRLLKMFSKRNNNWSLPGGLILSTLLVECYSPDKNRDDVAFYNSLVNIKGRLENSLDVYNPSDDSILLNSGTKQQSKTRRLKERLQEYIPKLDGLFKEDCDEEKAKKIWKKFFNHDYWKAEEVQKSETAARHYETGYYGERYNLSVSYEIFDLNVTEKIRNLKTRRGTRLVPKHYSILFEATHNIPKPYVMEWRVINDGDEAHEVEDIEHVTETESLIHSETSKYRGTHKMIVSVKRNNSTLIKREVEVHIV
ncbi:nucleotide-binding domain-containing protein [Sutcliffiella deserti]|uniref:nucleotide-binding domain-containing protein n=1 Tax=Sutcliffiella deserti TaxID=2875501 RepID=UPI001CC0CD7C|nr:hypothetical protein [Sutcliffiella deserti]